MNKQEFIDLIVPAAVEAYEKYNILPSLTLAQAALESSWGKSAPGNMLFGIKWSEKCGYDWQLLWTKEYINGNWVKVQAKFRKYESFAESIADHAKLLLNSRYAKVRTAENYHEACNAIYQAGYATDPNYPDKLISLIETYNLNRWDGRDEDEMVRYQRLADVPEDFRGTIKVLMDAGIIVGDGSDPVGNNDVIDLSHDQVRTLVILYRGGCFDRKLIAVGMKPAIAG